MTDWGQSGLVADIDTTNGKVWTSEPIDFGDEASEGVIYFVAGDGDLLGPYIATPTADAHCISCGLPLRILQKQLR